MDETSGAGGRDDGRIVIRSEDLDPEIEVEQPSAPSAATSLPNLGPAPVAVGVQVPTDRGLANALSRNTVVSGAVAGILGGAAGFFVAENLFNPEKIDAETLAGVRMQSGIWTLIFGLVLGGLLMAWDSLLAGVPRKAARDGLTGMLVGAVAGFIGGYIAQWIYSEMLKNILEDLSNVDPDDLKNKFLLARTVGWAVMGGLMGAGLGIRGGSKKILNGLVGGVVGGAIGGAIFQLVGNSETFDNGFLLRLAGLSATGLGIGLGVGLVEQLRRETWVEIAGGPMAGKEFILYNPITRIGRDHRCDLVLVKDPAVSAFHVTFQRDGSGIVWASPENGSPMTVNGVASPATRLRDGDLLGIGASSLRYRERVSRS